MAQTETAAPQVVLTFPADMSDTLVAELVADAELDESFVEVRKQPWGFSAGLEWAMPTMIVAYILKPYFDGLLKEAGKDHYALLAAGLKRLAAKWHKQRTIRVAASGSPHKLSSNYHQSGLFSIVVQTRSGQQVKMLFDEALSQADWEDAIDGFLAFAALNHAHYPNDPLTVTTAAAGLTSKPTSALYGVYNRETKQWEFQDDSTMLAMQQQADS